VGWPPIVAGAMVLPGGGAGAGHGRLWPL